MKKLIYLLLLTCFAQFSKAQLVSSANGKVSFFSETPVENIEAHSSRLLSVINTEKKEVAFSVTNTSFEFKNKLMQEHFNEKYMESGKYPTSTFKGRINEDVDLTKDGDYKVTVTGKLNIHGVEKERTIGGTLKVKDKEISLSTAFKVLVKDHKIEIPSIVVSNIAEEIEVKVDAKLAPKK